MGSFLRDRRTDSQSAENHRKDNKSER